MGSNRGMEQHPIIGFNYRISELHAAIGAAQTRKVPQILAANKKNKTMLMNALKGVPGVSFARIPDASGDSSTFLNLMLPDTETAKRIVEAFAGEGVGGFNYWYINMYHFINQWGHLKDLKSAAPLPVHHYNKSQDYNALNLPKSQEVVGRLISFGIRCTWTEKEILALAARMKTAIEKVVAVKTYA